MHGKRGGGESISLRVCAFQAASSPIAPFTGGV